MRTGKMTVTGESKTQRRPKKLPKALSKADILTIINKAKRERKRDYILLETLWRTGMRVAELVNLKKCDVKDGYIIVREGKGKQDRTIPLDKTLDTILGLYIDGLKGGEQTKLFDMTTRNVQHICHKYSPYHFATQGDKTVRTYEAHPHTYRHSFAVNWIREGGNIRALQKILGHKHLDTTAIYLDLTAEDLKAEMEKVSFE